MGEAKRWSRVATWTAIVLVVALVLLGSGIAGYSLAHELDERGVEFVPQTT